MRELLFRGKQAYNDKWAFSEYPFGTIHCGAVVHDFIPETVGQYTGLTDKNGKRIFEGDILDCGDRIVRVSWHEMCGTWDCNFVRYKGNLCSNGITPVEWKYRAEIIGNIHDNPEFLKGE